MRAARVARSVRPSASSSDRRGRGRTSITQITPRLSPLTLVSGTPATKRTFGLPATEGLCHRRGSCVASGMTAAAGVPSRCWLISCRRSSCAGERARAGSHQASRSFSPLTSAIGARASRAASRARWTNSPCGAAAAPTGRPALSRRVRGGSGAMLSLVRSSILPVLSRPLSIERRLSSRRSVMLRLPLYRIERPVVPRTLRIGQKTTFRHAS